MIVEASGKTVGKRVGVMGGTFNPIHVGHLMLAEWAMESAGLDEVLFMPAGKPYMKNGIDIQESFHRLRMVALAVEDHPCFVPSGMEIDRVGDTYTCDTMEQLKKEHPENDFYFIMGADCLFTIDKWKDPERIFASCHVIAAARNGSPLEKMEKKCRDLSRRYGAKLLLLAFPNIEISSTDIRDRVRLGESIRYLVPDKVREYIAENQLYLE